MARFEYLGMTLCNETNWAKIRMLPASERPKFEDTWSISIWRPGATEAEILDGADWLVAANVLGSEGWKLVSHDVLNAIVAGEVQGWPEASTPVTRVWYFMREVAS